MMAHALPQLDNSEYTVGWITALPHETAAAVAMLDKKHASPPHKHEKDHNKYAFGSVNCESGEHYVVTANLPLGNCGNVPASTTAAHMLSSFPAIKFGLMVGIGGGIWSERNDIRLGDVVVSKPEGSFGGLRLYDVGKATVDGFQCCGSLNKPPRVLLNAIGALQSKHEMERSMVPDILRNMHIKYPDMKEPRTGPGYVHQGPSNDRLFRSDYRHQSNEKNCHAWDEAGEIVREERPDCDPFIHYGTIASGNKIIKDAQTRDLLAQDCLCFETEAAGLMNDFPCLVIRGICDYCDSHKNDQWQRYAAATAAAYAKELLRVIDPADVNKTPRAIEVKSIHDQVTRVQKQVTEGFQSLRQGQDKHDRRDILKWITHIDYGPQYSDILKKRCEGTGQWLLDSTGFQNWLKSKGQTLFCPRTPGEGKTILSALVVDHLGRKFGKDSSIGIACLFCEYHRHSEQTLEHLFLSLLKQQSQQQTTLPDCVTELYDWHQKRTTRPSIDEITNSLQSVAATLSRVFVIVDALDECQTTDGCQMDFISKLLTLQGGVKANIFATSRHIDRIRREFHGCISLEINATDEDVKMYLRGQRRRFVPDMVNDQLQSRIESKVITASANMFLLAALHMDRLVKLKTRQDMIDFLESIQGSDLSTAYKITMKIESQDNNCVSLAKQILAWIIHARRPFSVEELRHVLAIRAGSKQFNPGYMPSASDILSVCAGLVTIDNERGIIRLVHYTTLEFLQQTKPDWLQDMQADVAEICLTYLLYDCFQVGSCRTDQAFEAEFDFYEYAAANWGYHAGIGRSSNVHLARKAKIQALLDQFLATEPLPPSFLYWMFQLKKNIVYMISALSPGYFGSRLTVPNLVFSPLNWLTEETWTRYHLDEIYMYGYKKMALNPLLEAFVAASLVRARLVLAPCPHPEHWHNLYSVAYEDCSPRGLDDGTHGCRKSCTPEAVKSLNRSDKTFGRLLCKVLEQDKSDTKPGQRVIPPEVERNIFPTELKQAIFSFMTDSQIKTKDVTGLLQFFEHQDAPQRYLEELWNLTVILLLKTKAEYDSGVKPGQKKKKNYSSTCCSNRDINAKSTCLFQCIFQTWTTGS